MVFLHGFVARYDLPISLPVYLVAAGAVVVVSFVLVAVFTAQIEGEAALRYPRRRLPPLEAAAAAGWPLTITRLIGALVLAAIVVIGIFGRQEAGDNAAEYLLWIYFWAALVILGGLAGNLFNLFNPFQLLPDPAKPRALPERLGIWPAVLGYFAFACLELTSGYAAYPRVVGICALVYSGLTIAGILTFGKKSWVGRVDPFAMLFAVIARFGPIEVDRDEVYLRPWGAGLLRPSPAGWDRVLLVILMLSTLAFDGIVATPAWNRLNAAAAPTYLQLGGLGFFLFRTLGLVALTLLFLAVFALVMQAVLALGSGARGLETTTLFAYTLVPIALVYNAAHNYTYLLVQSQGLIPALAEPLGNGWHLYQAGEFVPNRALAGAAVVWYVQVILIVLGHVVAVYLSHLRAAERFAEVRAALLSEYPMLVLMVLYTMTSLWILAQPITRSPG